MTGAQFERFEQVTLHHITYASSGLRISGWLALPPTAPGASPAVIFNRGGTGPRGALSDVGAMAFIGLYASWGYVGIASNYRGVAGSDGHEEWGGGDVDDAMNTLGVLEGLQHVDMDRLGLVGGSRGGMMALMMLRRTQRFRAAVTFGAPTSIHLETARAYIRSTMAKHLAPNTIQQHEAEQRSATVWAGELSKSTPLLVLHGSGDRRVPADHALTLGLELQKTHHPFKLIIYDNADHVLAGRRQESTQDVRWWLDHYVRDKAPLPRTGPHGA
jgi:dipeptidyl aminopeptidase/acylaminoacyl peptidase